MDATPLQKDDHIVDDARREEERRNKRMEDMGFSPINSENIARYELYEELRREIDPQIRRTINLLKQSLPKEEDIVESSGYRSGEINEDLLIDARVFGEQKIFTRRHLEAKNPVFRIFETIVLDTSPSMYTHSNYRSGCINPAGCLERNDIRGTQMYEALKAVIIRTEVLEAF